MLDSSIRARHETGSVDFVNPITSKGQLILKCPFGVKTSSKKNNENFSRISTLASKMRLNQKIRELFYH